MWGGGPLVAFTPSLGVWDEISTWLNSNNSSLFALSCTNLILLSKTKFKLRYKCWDSRSGMTPDRVWTKVPSFMN